MATLTIYTDGGARGNPGPSAVGVVLSWNQTEICHGRCIGTATNNIAEYQAVLDAVGKIKEIEDVTIEKLAFFLDSQLVERQLNGIYKIKEPTLQVLATKIKTGLAEIALPYTFTHIPRAQNAKADKLVNQALDSQ